ncbi:MAG: histone deacetylase [bacterium]
MIAIAYNELDYLHNLESHVENSQRTKTIIDKIQNYINPEKHQLFIAKNLEYSKEIMSIVKQVHDPTYLEFLTQKINNTKKLDFLDSDTYITPKSLDVVLKNLELTFETVSWIVKNSSYGFAYIRPPGHHAESNKAMGFCIINNAAVIAKYIQNYLNLKRIMIVDFDAHHGNGTQEIFYQDDSVLYFSTHAYPFYPFTGSQSEKGAGKGLGFNYNFPVSIYASDKDLIPIYQNEFTKIFDKFEPEFVIVSSGYDIHSHDPITYMNCSIDGITQIETIILQKTNHKNTLFLLEGGYNTNVLEEIATHDINRIK